MCESKIYDMMALASSILNAPKKGQRHVIAITGPPGSGKSTIANGLIPLISQALRK
jgi:putative protein kinase ArgK-like GTPase of G3E family